MNTVNKTSQWTLPLAAFALVALLGLTFNTTGLAGGGDDLGTSPFDFADAVYRAHRNVDAVIVERNGGATTSSGYDIYLVGTGKPVSKEMDVVAQLYGAVRSDQAYGANLKWPDTNNLAVEYLKAQSAKLLKDSVTVAGEQITVKLRDGISDHTAPAGGMLYNLRKKS